MTRWPVQPPERLAFDGEERLVRFVASEWPPVDGECLVYYACCEDGYGVPCVSRSGPCGWRARAAYPDVPGRDEDDARRRWIAARVAWLEAHGRDSFDVWMDDVAESYRVSRRRAGW